MAHLLTAYAAATQSKIGKPYILEKYFPLPFDKYIVFAPISKPAKNYSYYSDALEIIIPILNKEGITCVQVGATGEVGFQGCYQLQGKTSLNQVYFLLKNSLLYLGADTYASHFASALGIPSITLISNNFSSNVRGYWNQDKQVILEPDRTKRKPTFQMDEGNNKQINEIKVEDIAASTCKLLNIPFNFPYETIYIGESYTNKILETVPTSIAKIDNLGTDSIVVRMDYEFNEQNLAFQAQHCPVIIVTDKPINLELLKAYKPRIKQIFYIITKDHNPTFASAIQKLSIPLQIFSCLPEEELNKFKLDYIDIAAIMPKNNRTKDKIKEIKDIPANELYYKSCKHTLYNGKIYPSKAAWIKNQPCEMINQIMPVEPVDCDEFYQDSEYAMIFRKK